MKFGKEFRTHLEETLPEWRDKFLCYKPLKKLLKRFPYTISSVNNNNNNTNNHNNSSNNDQNQLGVRNNEDGGGPSRRSGSGSVGPSAPTERSMPLEEFQYWFVRLLNDELDKLNDFYIEKEEEFVIHFQLSIYPALSDTTNIPPDASSLGEASHDIYRSTLSAIRTIQGLRTSSTYNPLSFAVVFRDQNDEGSGAVAAENSFQQ